MRSHFIVLAGAAIGASASLHAGPPTIVSLVKEGNSVSGVGLVTLINSVAVNDYGEILVEADTDAAANDVVLLRGGAVYLQEGNALAAPAGATISSFDSININIAGDSAWNLNLAGTGGTSNDSGIFLNADLVQQESAFMTAPGFSASTPLIGIFEVKTNDSGRFLSVLSVDDPAIATTVDRALVLYISGGATQRLIAMEGDTLPESGIETVAEFGTGPHTYAYDALDRMIFFADLTGATTADGVLYLADASDPDAPVISVLAREGSLSPLPPRLWTTLSSPEVDINPTGGHVYSGALDGDAASNVLLVRNGAKFKQEGDSITTGSGTWAFTTFGSGPLWIDKDGDVLWYGDWTDPDTTSDKGLFLNDDLIIQEGVTVIDGLIVDTVRGIESGYALSPNGRFAVVRVVLVGGIEDAVLIDFGTPCPGDFDSSGEIGFNDLTQILLHWGPCPPSPWPCVLDLDGSGDVGFGDFTLLLLAWGAC